MKLIVFVVVSFISTSLSSKSIDIDMVRTNFGKAINNKAICKTMMQDLESVSPYSSLYQAYLGAYQTIWPVHTYNPLSKLGSFIKGKNNIERAILRDPKNIEIRYIRLFIQKNAPRFLGYHGNIIEDTEFIEKNKEKVTNSFIRDNIKIILK